MAEHYKVFENLNISITDTHPELSFILNGISTKELAIKIDTMLRYVLYFYDRTCELHPMHTNILKAREAALAKFDIPRGIYEKDVFMIIESEMASRFMLWHRDNEFSVYVTISIQLEEINNSIRTLSKTASWSEREKSMKSSKDIMDLSEQIDSRRKTLFGNMDYIEKFIMQKEVENRYKAETAML